MTREELYQIENRTPVRVTYRDTDQMGHVYYANHLVWFEIGRTELVRQFGQAYRDLESRGVFLPVIEARVHYRAPARYDDVLEIRTRVAKLSPVGIAFAYRIVRNDKGVETLIAEGSTRHPFLGRDGKILKTGLEILNIER
ncbi:MAG: acyl-CoA thioesterase [Candidatus Sumerlaeia bacterium]|nr:acyl-CoA thioesterase [Candidatus Sumerlaeia bacterium]